MAAIHSADVLRRIAGFLGPRVAQRIRRVCVRWRTHVTPRCWHAAVPRGLPLLSHLQCLASPPPWDAIVVEGGDPAAAMACYAAVDGVLTHLLPCPSTLVLRPFPVSCLSIVTLFLWGCPRPCDLDLEIPTVVRGQRDPAVDALVTALVSSPVPMARLAVGLGPERESTIRRILAYAYRWCTEVVIRVRSPETLHALCSTVRALAPSAPHERMRALVVRTMYTQPDDGELTGGLTEALQALPPGLTHVELDLRGCHLGDFEYASRLPVSCTGPRLERLRVRAPHTRMTVRGLGLLLKAFGGIRELELDPRSNGWGGRDWSILGRLCHAVSGLVVATSSADTGWQTDLRESLALTSRAVLRIVEATPKHEAHNDEGETDDEDVMMEDGQVGV